MERAGSTPLNYLTVGRPEGEAHAIWSGIVGQMFRPASLASSDRLPVGSASGFVMGEMIVARVVFPGQSFLRDQALSESTPGHILLHLYMGGGCSGSINGQQVTIRPGQVAVIDLRFELSTQATSSDTIALVLPRRLVPIADDASPLPPRVAPARNSVLADWMRTLRGRVAGIGGLEADELVAETAALVDRLLDGTRPLEDAGPADGQRDLRTAAEDLIRDNLGADHLSPAWLAGAIGTSRATLYRVFESTGGVKRAIQEGRLEAARSALADPLETRRLSQIAASLGFGSKAHFSRSFRARYGVTASAHRASHLAAAASGARTSLQTLEHVWRRLGRPEP